MAKNIREGKRKEYITWQGYFMGLAAIASFRSKDPNTQNGVCIVDPISNSPLALGYNGFPRGCEDDEYPWGKTGDYSETKYPYVEHAERNAIYNAVKKGVSLDNSEMYIYSERGYLPCDSCARAIIQSGIREVVLLSEIDGRTDVYDWTATRKMLASAGVGIRVLSHRGSYCQKDDSYMSVAESVEKDFLLIAKKMVTIHKQLSKDKRLSKREGKD